MRHVLHVLCLLCAFSVSASAQSTDAATSWSSLLIGKKFVLRNFSVATEVHGTWDGQTLHLDPPPFHMLADLKVKKIRIKPNEIKIEADRSQLLRDKQGRLTEMDASSVTITLTGNSASLMTALPDALFYKSFDDASATIPEKLRDIVFGARLTGSPAQADGSCDLSKGGGMQMPKVLSSVEADFTAEARQRKINGSVEIAILVDPSGKVSDEWIVRELGYGLDAAAALAVSQYKFSPATCHEQPISIGLSIEVNFQM